MPDGIPPLSIDEAIAGADVVMMLRVQRERLEAELGDAPGEYLARYGLTSQRLATASRRRRTKHRRRSRNSRSFRSSRRPRSPS
jgi:aspartate carbamoyltransferase catalytic subunit